jgi:hypothetical protein
VLLPSATTVLPLPQATAVLWPVLGEACPVSDPSIREQMWQRFMWQFHAVIWQSGLSRHHSVVPRAAGARAAE